MLNRAHTLHGVHLNKETLILVGHYVFSGMILLPSVSLLAIPVGDVTKTGTSAGQRWRKRTNSLRDNISLHR